MPAHHKLKGKEGQIVRMYNAGKPVAEIAEETNVTRQAIYAFISRSCKRSRPTIECAAKAERSR